ncbi:MAG: hypothetical protein U0Y10_25370 [Spirosomataceae bacterium]
MLLQTEGIIHLATQREPTLCGAKTQVASLTLNDKYLKGGFGYKTQLLTKQWVVIVPFIGDLDVKANGKQVLLEENQALSLVGEASTEIEITNPYDTDTVNFFELLLEAQVQDAVPTVVSIDVQQHKNQLIPIAPTIWIGQYDGRVDDVFHPKNLESKVFVYVLSGAFEVQNRLLETRDAVTLWHTDEVEFEALSNDAVLLIVALP